jgi:hypothetical protein
MDVNYLPEFKRDLSLQAMTVRVEARLFPYFLLSGISTKCVFISARTVRLSVTLTSFFNSPSDDVPPNRSHTKIPSGFMPF